MTFLNTQHKKRSFTVTTIVLLVLLILMFYLGLGYVIPPPETGISVNFGTENTGSGPVQPEEKIKTAPKEEQPQNTQTEQEPSPEKTEEVLAGNEEDVPVIAPKKTKTPPKKEKTPSKAAKDALSNILNGPKADEKSSSTGNDSETGNKGQTGGDPYANSYYGSPGTTGTGVSYGLKGRTLLSTGKVQQDCNEEGRVVVRIVVDKKGNVIDALAGVKGTTNTHPCLLEPAKKTALMYHWKFDSEAPSRQIGFVVINFKLGG